MSLLVLLGGGGVVLPLTRAWDLGGLRELDFEFMVLGLAEG